MGSKKKPKSKGKGQQRKPSKVSISKLSNKRLNKLAKQGKLKKKLGKQKYVKLLKERTGEENQPKEIDLEQTVAEARAAKREEVDIPLTEADYDYYSTPGRDYSFLTDVEDSKIKKPRRKRRNPSDENDDVEAQYEASSAKRAHVTSTEVKNLLPIKNKQGVIAQSIQVELPKNADEDEYEENEHHDGSNVAPAEPLRPLSTAELYMQRKLKLEEKKQRIALLANVIIANPNEYVKKVKELREMLEETDPDIFLTVRKLTLVSLMEIFKDIIPSYRIRPSTEKEKQQSAKKETKQLRDFEESLLNNYKRYLEAMENLIKGKPSKKKGWPHKAEESDFVIPPQAAKELREVCLRCMCELLLTHPHFNFRTNIIAILVPYMNNKRLKLADMACNYVKKIFREDRTGDVTLEITRLIGRMIKSRNNNVDPKVLRTFLSLPIKKIESAEEEAKKKKVPTATLR